MGIDPDTVFGGPRREFPTTIWSQLVVAANPSADENSEAWDTLIHRYWKPVYAYIRRYWRKTNEESKDLAQGFFLWLIQRGNLKALNPEWSSFRGYLKTALAHYLTDSYRRDQRQKRGGGMSLASLDEIDPSCVELSESPERTPEQEFDLQWGRTLLAEALRELETQLTEAGKQKYFQVFSHYFLRSVSSNPGSGILGEDPTDEPTYRDLAKTMGLSETDIGNYLSHCRKELRQILRARIMETVTDSAGVDQELREVLGG